MKNVSPITKKVLIADSIICAVISIYATIRSALADVGSIIYDNPASRWLLVFRPKSKVFG